MDPVERYLNEVRAACPELPGNGLSLLRAGLSVRALPAGGVFTDRGQTQREMGYVAQGLLKAVHMDEHGNEMNINFLHEGTVAGHYQAFIGRGASRYRFQCIEPSVLVRMSRELFDTCCARVPGMERFFRQQIERALFGYIARTEALLVADARQRYLQFIRHHAALARRISVTDLCSYLGMRRQTLTRIRRRLEGVQVEPSRGVGATDERSPRR